MSPGLDSRCGNKRIEVVAADAAQDLGEAAVDLLGMLGGQSPGHAVAGTFQVLLGAFGLELRLRQAASSGPGCRRTARS